MSTSPHRRLLRETLMIIDALASRFLPGAAACVLMAMGGCKGDGQTAEPVEPAAAMKDEGRKIFGSRASGPEPVVSWSTNAAPPPEHGEIREIGSIFDALPQGAFGAPVPVEKNTQTGPVDSSASSWTIALGVFRGDNNQQEAADALGRIRREGRLPGAYLQRRGAATLIAYGRYTGPSDPKAQADLEQVQSVRVNGSQAYPTAYLCPPYQMQATSRLGEYDLRRARQLYGDAAMYTLQVGWYGREELQRATEADLKDSRVAAEEAAARLRAEGELAFYYHGPNRSMVTVGVFDSTDFDPVNNPGFESARLRETRRRRPLNLYNGAGYSYKTAGMRDSKLLSSGLVKIPSK